MRKTTNKCPLKCANTPPKQFDCAGTVVIRLLAWKEAGVIRQHHCAGFTKSCRIDRAEIVWTPESREAVCVIEPPTVRCLLAAASEAGLHVGELGRRIRIRPNQRRRTASIRVPAAMGEGVDETPRGRPLVLANASGKALTPHSASEGLRPWPDMAGHSPRLWAMSCACSCRKSHLSWGGAFATRQRLLNTLRASLDESGAVLAMLATSKGVQHEQGRKLF